MFDLIIIVTYTFMLSFSKMHSFNSLVLDLKSAVMSTVVIR